VHHADGAVHAHRAAVGPQLAGGDRHQRGLPRAVLADQADDLARREAERDVVDGERRAEAFDDVLESQNFPRGTWNVPLRISFSMR